MTALSEAIARSDVPAALASFDAEMAAGADAWEIHETMFAAAQKVLNPPFINPHLPKMYGILRELVPLLRREEIPPLIRLEMTEYARRPKLQEISWLEGGAEPLFRDIEESLALGTEGETPHLMASFTRQQGLAEFARRILLLGSGYLEKSLGHSISCTAFILLEAMQRRGEDLPPVFDLLSDYFHKGRFCATPPLRPEPVSVEEMNRHLLRAVSGRGIIALHDTITIYAIDRVRHLFSGGEQCHLVRAWIDYLGNKQTEEIQAEKTFHGEAADYPSFYSAFSSLDAGRALSAALPLAGSEEGRSRLGRYLTRGACDLYNGKYNPHNITGIGSLLWVLNGNPGRQMATNALYQYLDYLFNELRSGKE